jgi:anti-sigma-K factor RskA/putative zinc finger protein
VNEHVADDLGLYAAGLLEPSERREAELHLDACAECRAALLSEERTAWTLAEAASRPPPPALRARIVAAHARSTRSRAPGRSWPRLALVAGLAIALVAVVVDLQATRAQLDREAALASEYRAALAALAGGGRVVALSAAEQAAGRGSLVFAPDGGSYLVLEMPTPPEGKAYEAWVIRDGEPLPAGVAPARGGVVVIRLTAPARPGDVAAVTLEVAAGVEKPTTPPILSGKI